VQAVKASAHSIFLLITMGAIIFVGATSTTISWSLGKWIKPKLSPFFLDIYGCHYVCSDCITMSCSLSRQCKPGFSLSFLDIYGCHNVCSDYWHNYFLQPGQAVLVSPHYIFPCQCSFYLSLISMARRQRVFFSNCFYL
jgi:hypothetical protein